MVFKIVTFHLNSDNSEFEKSLSENISNIFVLISETISVLMVHTLHDAKWKRLHVFNHEESHQALP